LGQCNEIPVKTTRGDYFRGFKLAVVDQMGKANYYSTNHKISSKQRLCRLNLLRHSIVDDDTWPLNTKRPMKFTGRFK